MPAGEQAIRAKQTRLETCYRKIREYEAEISTINKSLLKMRDKGFCVYMALVEGTAVYVGEGLQDRWKHCLSGASSCAELNRDYYQGKPMEVYIISEGITKEEAQQLEDEIVYNLRPKYNRRIPYGDGITHYEASEYFWMVHGGYLVATANIDTPEILGQFQELRKQKMKRLTSES